MALRIASGFLFNRRWLKVTAKGLRVFDEGMWAGAKRFSFNQVQSILMSNDHILSFQIDRTVYSVPTKPGSKKHQETIATLLREVSRTDTSPPLGSLGTGERLS